MSCTVKACRICLATNSKLYNYNNYQLKLYYEQIMASNVKESDGLPCYFCYECAAMLHKFHKFKEKCYIGQKLLKKLIRKEPITLKSIRRIKRHSKSLQSSLNIITTNTKVKTLIIKQRSLTRTNKIKEPFEIHADADPVSDDDDYEEELPPLPELITEDKNIDIVQEKSDVPEAKVIVDETNKNIDEQKTNEDEKIVPTLHFFEDTDTGFGDDDRVLSDPVKDDNGVTEPVDEEENIPEKRKKKNTRSSNKKKTQSKDTDEQKRFKKNNAKKKYDLDPNNWLKINFTEEQAIEEFKSRALQNRYVAAQFKCDMCLKGFSKEDMLNRHNKLRHAESAGPIECRFCHMRFKRKCFLSRHMRQHFTKYQCLRCDLVCPLDTTAQFHEDYHNGVIRKCGQCGQEFKHLSTYYTHLRTHRSEHVCPLCGASFVSQIGLKMHRKIKHVKTDTAKTEETSKEEQEFCKRCDIKFETKKAYDEHLIHSAMHVDGIDSSDAHEKISPSKVLAKEEQAKITEELRKRSSNDNQFNFKKNIKYKRQRRQPTIPTTCHQCGAHFTTQAACMKHHMEAHPRTSFHAPNERYICEICGVSLAQGSIAMHQNRHTREKLHTCDTCGKQFHAFVGLKRHMVTHTGEKPFPCPLCDKRFTQSNSMQLHYKTFHLKQPYPKRNRRKNKNEPKTMEAEESNSSDSSDEKGSD